MSQECYKVGDIVVDSRYPGDLCIIVKEDDSYPFKTYTLKEIDSGVIYRFDMWFSGRSLTKLEKEEDIKRYLIYNGD